MCLVGRRRYQGAVDRRLLTYYRSFRESRAPHLTRLSYGSDLKQRVFLRSSKGERQNLHSKPTQKKEPESGFEFRDLNFDRKKSNSFARKKNKNRVDPEAQEKNTRPTTICTQPHQQNSKNKNQQIVYERWIQAVFRSPPTRIKWLKQVSREKKK